MTDMNVLAGAGLNAVLLLVIGWMINDKIKNVDFRISRIEKTFFNSENNIWNKDHDK